MPVVVRRQQLDNQQVTHFATRKQEAYDPSYFALPSGVAPDEAPQRDSKLLHLLPQGIVIVILGGQIGDEQCNLLVRGIK